MDMSSRGHGICLYVGEVHACTIAQVHACTITLVHACTLVTVHVILELQSGCAILVGNYVKYLFVLAILAEHELQRTWYMHAP